jgi:cysteinyl-tRNA synthetase
MRHLIIRLGDLARDGGREARPEQRFNDADRIRAILSECGVEVQDTPSGTAWALAHA